jgi:hypothetical protein
MGIKRKLDNETNEQRVERLSKEQISNYSTRSEKTSWNRKLVNLEKTISEKIRPIEEQIQDMQVELQPLYDEIKYMRSSMVKTCVHPYNLLVFHNNNICCKFCNKTLTSEKYKK